MQLVADRFVVLDRDGGRAIDLATGAAGRAADWRRRRRGGAGALGRSVRRAARGCITRDCAARRLRCARRVAAIRSVAMRSGWTRCAAGRGVRSAMRRARFLRACGLTAGAHRSPTSYDVGRRAVVVAARARAQATRSAADANAAATPGCSTTAASASIDRRGDRRWRTSLRRSAARRPHIVSLWGPPGSGKHDRGLRCCAGGAAERLRADWRSRLVESRCAGAVRDGPSACFVDRRRARRRSRLGRACFARPWRRRASHVLLHSVGERRTCRDELHGVRLDRDAGGRAGRRGAAASAEPALERAARRRRGRSAQGLAGPVRQPALASRRDASRVPAADRRAPIGHASRASPNSRRSTAAMTQPRRLVATAPASRLHVAGAGRIGGASPPSATPRPRRSSRKGGTRRASGSCARRSAASSRRSDWADAADGALALASAAAGARRSARTRWPRSSERARLRRADRQRRRARRHGRRSAVTRGSTSRDWTKRRA